MKHFIWLIKDKTNVPFKVLETTHSSIFQEHVASLLEDGKQFACRVEND